MFSNQKQKHLFALTGTYPFLHLIVSLLILLSYATSVTATSTYTVANDSEVPVRSGQGTEYKILALLQNGETVTSLEEDGYWIRIRTATNREGWMLKRYLSSTLSADDAFTLPPESNQTGKQPENPTLLNEQGANALQPDKNVPAENTSEQIEIKQKDPVKEIEELRARLAAITRENKELQENERIQWFLAGGGILVVGWLIGLITCRARRRKPSLL